MKGPVAENGYKIVDGYKDHGLPAFSDRSPATASAVQPRAVVRHTADCRRQRRLPLTAPYRRSWRHR